MGQLDTILTLMALLAGLYSIADKIRVPYPILLVIGGLLIGLIPGLPVVHLDPTIVFLIFLPPLLYEASGKISWHDFKKYRRPIATQALGLVLFTTAGIAVVAHTFIPGFTWPLAFLLGAIVSPPDAVAATSATKGLGLPKRIVTILEGESLVNDASALIAYRFALIAVMGGTFVLTHAAFQFLLVAAGGIAIGLAIGYAFTLLHKYILDNPPVETTISLLMPFISYLLAEHLRCSGVLAVVSNGLFIAWRSSELFSFQTRMKMGSFWEMFVFLLNGFVFILIGLQLPDILANASIQSMDALIGYGLLVSFAAIFFRIIWVFPVAWISSWLAHWRDPCLPRKTTARRNELFIIAWAGMRGIVSLASALALPLTLADGTDFPMRNVILFITFVVILVTLVFQGLSLPFFVRFLKVQEPNKILRDEETNLRLDLLGQVLTFITEKIGPTLEPRVLDELRERFERRLNYLNEILENNAPHNDHLGRLDRNAVFLQYLNAEMAVLNFQREQLLKMHHANSYGTDVIQRVERELDAWNLNLSKQIKLFGRLND